MLWVFGYGSLVYRPSFPFVRSEIVSVAGYARRFWQGSPDHRGTPEMPGRVVTIIPEPGTVLFGRAYEIADTDHDAVLGELDDRESGGYERLYVPLHTRGGELVSERGLTYVAVDGNPSWLGPASLEEIAKQMRGKKGKSGTNEAYVRDLADALRSIETHDDHVFGLVDLLDREPAPG